MHWIAYSAFFIMGGVLGFFFCSALTAKKIDRMEYKIWQLEKLMSIK